MRSFFALLFTALLSLPYEAAAQELVPAGLRVQGRCARAFSNGKQVSPLPAGGVCSVKVQAPAFLFNVNAPGCAPAVELTLSLAYPQNAGRKKSAVRVVLRKHKTAFDTQPVLFKIRLPRQSGAILSAEADGGLQASFCSSLEVQPQACEQYQQDYERLLSQLQSCTQDSECGQILPLGCGCSSDAVIRLDADATVFHNFLEEAAGANCLEQLPLVSICVCRETAGFKCEAGQCQWRPADPDIRQG